MNSEAKRARRFRLTLQAAIAVAIFAAGETESAGAAAHATRYFQICPSDGCGSPDDYVIALDDPAKLHLADNILSGKTKDQVHVRGTIVSQTANYNPNWKFHLDPSSITFITFGSAICGLYTSTRTVETNLDKVGTAAFLPIRSWCNVKLKLSKEIQPRQ